MKDFMCGMLILLFFPLIMIFYCFYCLVLVIKMKIHGDPFYTDREEKL